MRGLGRLCVGFGKWAECEGRVVSGNERGRQNQVDVVMIGRMRR